MEVSPPFPRPLRLVSHVVSCRLRLAHASSRPSHVCVCGAPTLHPPVQPYARLYHGLSSPSCTLGSVSIALGRVTLVEPRQWAPD